MGTTSEHATCSATGSSGVQGDAKADVMERQERDSARVVRGGSLAAGITGIAALALSILGLAGFGPGQLAAIAIIVLGAGLLIGGGMAARQVGSLLYYADSDSLSDFDTGMTLESIGGGVGLVLGILGLLGVVPSVLLPIAVIVMGAGMLISSNSLTRLDSAFWPHASLHGFSGKPRIDGVSAAAVWQGFVGMASLVLGILAVLNAVPIVVEAANPIPMLLVLISTLALGCSALISNFALGSRMHMVYAH